jgi:hypothetical protein
LNGAMPSDSDGGHNPSGTMHPQENRQRQKQQQQPEDIARHKAETEIKRRADRKHCSDLRPGLNHSGKCRETWKATMETIQECDQIFQDGIGLLRLIRLVVLALEEHAGDQSIYAIKQGQYETVQNLWRQWWHFACGPMHFAASNYWRWLPGVFIWKKIFQLENLVECNDMFFECLYHRSNKPKKSKAVLTI